MQEDAIERLIRISKEHQLLPETYVPWQQTPTVDEVFLPEKLLSLEGMPVYDTLTAAQRLELGRHEVVQVMYSYGWGEALFCVFMSKYLLTLNPTSAEYRFLLRELIEEYRHQEMFTQAITTLGGQPVGQSKMHKFIGTFTTKLLPADYLFMGSLSVELITDMYGNQARKHPAVYLVLRKVFDLHNIEEGRHIIFTKWLLERYSSKAGFIKRTLYSYVILMNILFVRTMYVKREIYERIGLENPDAVYKQAHKHYKKKFADNCLKDIIKFVNEWGGFNIATRWAWRWVVGAKV